MTERPNSDRFGREREASYGTDAEDVGERVLSGSRKGNAQRIKEAAELHDAIVTAVEAYQGRALLTAREVSLLLSPATQERHGWPTHRTIQRHLVTLRDEWPALAPRLHARTGRRPRC